MPHIHNGDYYSDLWILASKNLGGKVFVTPSVNLGSPKCALLLNLAVKFSKNKICISERWLGEPNYGDILEELFEQKNHSFLLLGTKEEDAFIPEILSES